MIDPDLVNDAVLAVFGEDSPVLIDGIAVEASFDSRYYASETGEAGGASLTSSIGIKSAVAADIVVEQTVITVRGIDYVARVLRPDSDGWTVVELWKKPA